MSRRRAACAALLMLALTACGAEERALDGSQVEAQVAARIAATVGERPRVACPASPSPAKGTRFTCTVTAKDGQRSTAKVVVADDLGRFRYTLAPAGR